MFIIFGAFLERTGIADFFIQAANAVVGGFSGGPAKVAVVASALEGMVSGSSVANTVGSWLGNHSSDEAHGLQAGVRGGCGGVGVDRRADHAAYNGRGGVPDGGLCREAVQ